MFSRTGKSKDLSVAQERYVECIAEMEKDHGHAHVSLMALQLGIRKPSVVQMLLRLEQTGIIRRQDKEIALTERGRSIAGELDSRHKLLRDFMVDVLKITEKSAGAEACRLEHIVSLEFIGALRNFIKLRKARRSGRG